MSKKIKQLGWFCLIFVLGVLVAASDGKKPTVKDIPPRPVYTPDPEYTSSARHDKIEGTVTINLKLDADGIPHEMKIARSLRPDLDQKALEAVTKWRFSPAKKDGKPIPVFLSVEVGFKLR
jgi:periplasmic protein TonB